MRRFARLPSRVIAVAGAMFLGAVGTIALAAPAQATPAPPADVKVTHALACGPDADTALITWTVENQSDLAATVSGIDGVAEGIKVSDALAGHQTVTGTQVVKGGADSVRLRVTLKWGSKERGSVDVVSRRELSELECAGKATAEFTDNCDGSVVVKVTNPQGARKTRFAVKGDHTVIERFWLEGGQTSEVVVVPAAKAGLVEVQVIKSDDDAESDRSRPFATHEFTSPTNCYEVTHKSTCDKLIISVKNTGTRPIGATVTVGDEDATTRIEPGKDDAIELDATEGLVAKLTVEKTVTEIKWEKPANCGSTLPLTGVNSGLLAGAALVLVSGGAGLFYLARRRRVRFAA